MKRRPTKDPEFAKAMEVRSKYRRSLLKLGKSPDTHVYDLSSDFLSYARRCPERSFLIRVKLYYEDLNVQMKQLFIAEVLEKGRNYPFWYLEQYRETVFRGKQRDIYERVYRDFTPARA